MGITKIIVIGASGRMGKNNIASVIKNPGTVLFGAIDRADSACFNMDTGILTGNPANNILITDDLGAVIEGTDVIIDFSSPVSSLQHLKVAVDHQVKYVLGTTGFTTEQEEQIKLFASKTAIFKASNFSKGIAVISNIIKKTASILDTTYDIEIIEAHHNKKKDAPSGTAISLAKAAAEGRGLDLERSKISGRDGIIGERSQDEIGVMAIRGGGIVGEHTVMFISDEEVIEVRHSALTRQVFSAGAVTAAIYISEKSPGFYSMQEVLGLDK